MAQSTILAAGTTAATSTDVVVAAGASVTVGLFAATELTLQAGAVLTVMIDTPGADNIVQVLDNTQRQVQLFGPGTFRVKRPVTPAAFGVFLEV